MQEFIEYLVKSIVKNPSDVTVEEIHIEDTTYDYKVTVNPEDMGLIIGKEGRTIKSVRALAKAKAIKEQTRVNVELVEPEGSTRRPARDEAVAEEAPEAVEETTEAVEEAPEAAEAAPEMEVEETPEQ